MQRGKIKFKSFKNVPGYIFCHYQFLVLLSALLEEELKLSFKCVKPPFMIRCRSFFALKLPRNVRPLHGVKEEQ